MSSTRPHSSARLGERDPAELAKRVRKNHNLSALLLRLLDREEWRDTSSRTREQLSTRAVTAAKKAGLAAWPDAMVGGGLQLTALGRQVAKLMVPPKWGVQQTHNCDGWYVALVTDDGSVHLTTDEVPPSSSKLDQDEVLMERIAGLLNADDLAAAKVYQVKS